MNNTTKPFNAELAQIGWVVKDLDTAEKFFRDTMGADNFHKIDNFSVDGTYYGEPVNWVSHVRMAYAAGLFIELIQPVSGRSVFHDYLEKNPAGGVQHIAYRMPLAELDSAIAELAAKGYPMVTTVDTTIAKIVFFDTMKDTGVMTELMGITEQGWKIIEDMKE